VHGVNGEQRGRHAGGDEVEPEQQAHAQHEDRDHRVQPHAEQVVGERVLAEERVEDPVERVAQREELDELPPQRLRRAPQREEAVPRRVLHARVVRDVEVVVPAEERVFEPYDVDGAREGGDGRGPRAATSRIEGHRALPRTASQGVPSGSS
jgi:hypothetical protein